MIWKRFQASRFVGKDFVWISDVPTDDVKFYITTLFNGTYKLSSNLSDFIPMAFEDIGREWYISDTELYTSTRSFYYYSIADLIEKMYMFTERNNDL